MSVLVCGHCGSILTKNICSKCGYDNDIKNPYKNIIFNKKAKEDIGDTVLSYLINMNLITTEEFKNLVVIFGYLFLDHSDHYSTLVKVIIPKKKFRKEKIFYIAIQNNKLMLLKENFDDNQFKKISESMLAMHKVDLDSLNSKDFSMELR